MKAVLALAVLNIVVGDKLRLGNNEDKADCENEIGDQKSVAIGAIVGAVSVILVPLCCLTCIGFTCAGVRGGSPAAGHIQNF